MLSGADVEISYGNWMQKEAQISSAWLQQGWGRGRPECVLQNIKYIDLLEIKFTNLQMD